MCKVEQEILRLENNKFSSVREVINYANLLFEELDYEGFVLKDRGWYLQINPRLTRVLGKCFGKSIKKIQLSKNFLENNLHNFEAIDDVIRHEIAHAFDKEIRGTSDHSIIWKRIAEDLGANPLPISQFDVKIKTKYSLVCNSCKSEFAISRKPKRDKSCGKCRPKVFDKNLLLEVRQNY